MRPAKPGNDPQYAVFGFRVPEYVPDLFEAPWHRPLAEELESRGIGPAP